MNDITAKALEIAATFIGVRETKRNRGPEVDAFLYDVGLDPTKGDYPWCCAFLFSCFKRASLDLRVPNPMPKIAAVMRLWSQTPQWQRGLPAPGAIAIFDHGGGHGHCGIVQSVGAQVVNIEGNTNDQGSREGDGVYRKLRRPSDITGYIDYSLTKPAEPLA